MKKICTLLVVLFAALYVYGQTPFSIGYFMKCESGANNFQRTDDGGFIVGYAGRPGPSPAVKQTYMVKLDSAGVQQWSRSFPVTGNTQSLSVLTTGGSVTQLHDGGYIIATNYYTLNFFLQWRSCAYLVRTDSAGNALWSGLYPGQGESLARGVRETSDHGFIVCGETHDTVTSGQYLNAFLLKTDSMGNVQWGTSYGNVGMSQEIFYSAAEANNGDFIVCGSKGNGATNGLVVRTNSLGVVLWSRECAQPDMLTDVQELPGGDLLSLGPNLNFNYSAMYRLTASGASVWSKIYRSDSNFVAYSFAQTWDGFTLVAKGPHASRAGLTHFDYSGNPLWSRAYHDAFGSFTPEVLITADGGYAFAARYDGTTSTDMAMIVIKTDSAGMAICNDWPVNDTCIAGTAPTTNSLSPVQVTQSFPLTTVTTAITLLPAPMCLTTAVPETKSVSEATRIWPNPASDYVRIEYPPSQSDHVRVQLYDVTGKIILDKSGGSTFTELSLPEVQPGLYFVLVEADGLLIGQSRLIRR